MKDTDARNAILTLQYEKKALERRIEYSDREIRRAIDRIESLGNTIQALLDYFELMKIDQPDIILIAKKKEIKNEKRS